MDVEFWKSYVKEFQTKLPDKNEGMAKYLQVIGNIWYVDDDRHSLVCTSEEKVIHLSLENKTKEGTYKSQSKTILAALFNLFVLIYRRKRKQGVNLCTDTRLS